MKNTIPISQARREIFAIAERVQKPGQYFTLTENGRPKMVVVSAEQFESLVETVEVLRDFPDLEDDIADAQNEYRRGSYVALDEILAREGYIKITGRKKSHGLQGRRAKKRSRKS